MSGNTDPRDSDDEFHDALADVPKSKGARLPFEDAHEMDSASCNSSPLTTNEQMEEITRQQADLKLPDETEDNDEDSKIVDEASKLFTDDIDVEELREREKTMSSEELQQNKEQSDRMKLEGNELFKAEEPLRAIEIYTSALHICPTSCTKERAILYCNRAAAKIKLDSKKSAIDDCSKAIELWPGYVRALMRRAKLCEQEDRLEDALADYKRVCELEPNQREAQEAVAHLPAQINERNERLKTEMMSKLKDLGNMFLKPFGLSTDNFQMQQDPSTGSYSVNFQQNPR
ncbi:tetratricopeptide repeat protein 1 [Rhagoletis pomonella]|uniref:tetratricopeptide repeat protein 1 n=1 Tax=Rhagoletis pomonella TaxID=28610 RepID=UPI00177FF67E|nr:tetratricopeptide repeat protein 1 [Rhagoletis pomonella]XP_036342009.1 tetratricopeptide repeat protein 1 [Rhagoletis pomonella]